MVVTPLIGLFPQVFSSRSAQGFWLHLRLAFKAPIAAYLRRVGAENDNGQDLLPLLGGADAAQLGIVGHQSDPFLPRPEAVADVEDLAAVRVDPHGQAVSFGETPLFAIFPRWRLQVAYRGIPERDRPFGLDHIGHAPRSKLCCYPEDCRRLGSPSGNSSATNYALGAVTRWYRGLLL